MSCSFPLLNCMTNKYSYNLFKKKKKLRNMNLWHVLVKGSFFKNPVTIKDLLETQLSWRYKHKFLMANTDENIMG